MRLPPNVRYPKRMSETTVTPEQVLRSSLPVGTSLIVVFVQSKDRDGQQSIRSVGLQKFSTRSESCFVEQLSTRAAAECGAMTSDAAR